MPMAEVHWPTMNKFACKLHGYIVYLNVYFFDKIWNRSIFTDIFYSFSRYVIDVGCGGADKTNIFSREFHTIGIDYKANIETARQNYPYVQFYEIDLEGGNVDCKIDIPVEILYQSVVVSADVVEHIVDPKYCYLPIMKYLSQYAHALVFTTPDREGEGK